MDLVLGGLAAVGAGLFSNPLEVVKIRMQLQGELQATGKYARHYKNVFHAAYTIGTKDGITALQKGLVPALWYQWVMNGTRLGLYQVSANNGFTKKKDGSLDPIGSIVTATVAGGIGAVVGSPFFLVSIRLNKFDRMLDESRGCNVPQVKTQLQSRANDKSIAVGQQHQFSRMSHSFRDIYRRSGIIGFWRGCSSSLPRVMVASAVQLPTFERALQYMKSQKLFPEGSWMNAFGASMIAGLFVSFCMAPFDLVSTRFYNQGADPQGKGLVYKNIFQCAMKIYRAEGVLGFFKGWTANYFRLGPHTLLSLVFWERLKYYYHQNNETSN